MRDGGLAAPVLTPGARDGQMVDPATSLPRCGSLAGLSARCLAARPRHWLSERGAINSPSIGG